MIEIIPNLYIGNLLDYRENKQKEWAFVHATQTIHYELMGWDRKNNKPPRDHPNYIMYEKGNRLSLNWVDGPAHLYNWSGAKTFIAVLDFIDKHIKERKVLIHCNQGESRAPSLGLLYLAKRAKTISSVFIFAKTEFMSIFPNYIYSGIGVYLKDTWENIA